MTAALMERPEWPEAPDAQRAEVQRRLNAAVRADKSVVVVMSIVAVIDGRNAGHWHALFGRIDVCRKGDAKLGPRYDYGRVRCLSQQVAGRSIQSVFRAIVHGDTALTCDGTRLAPWGHIERWDVERHGSTAGYAEWPCLYLQRPIEKRTMRLPQGPLANVADALYFKDVWDLVGHVAQFRPFHGVSDARRDLVNLFIWDYAGRFASATARPDGQLALALAGKALRRLALRGKIVGLEGTQQVRSPARSSIVVRPEVQVGQVDFVLVDATGDIVDRLAGRWVPNEPVRTLPPDDRLEYMLRAGESSVLEYKPYVRLGDTKGTKWTEILETAIAMANASGGVVLLGVDDHGVPKFGPDEMKAVALEDFERLAALPDEARRAALTQAVKTYGGSLRDRIDQNVNRSLFLEMEIVWRGPCPVLLVTVPAGQDRPYMERQTQSIWVRTNATNRRPSEDELAEMFANRASRR